MKISVIIPAFNAEKYIQLSLKSLFSQDFNDFEIICVNDGSNDSTKDIIDSINDPRLRIINQRNAGVWKARLAGIAAAGGEYITFCDSDDYTEVNWLSSMYNRAIESDADITLCGFKRIDEKSGRIMSTEMVLNGEEEVSNDMIPLIFLNSSLWNKLFKAELFKNIFEPSVIPRVAEDTLFFASLCPNVKKIAFVPAALYNYNVIKTSAISSVNNEDLNNARMAFIELASQYPEDKKNYIAAIFFIHCAVALPLLMNVNYCQLIKENYSYLNKYLPNWKNILSLKYILSSKYKIKLIKIYIVLLVYKCHLFPLFVFTWKFLTNKCGISIKW